MKSITDNPNLTPCPHCERPCSVDAKACPNCGKPFVDESPQLRALTDEKIYNHILSQSSMKVGMCLTLLGLVRLVEGIKNVSIIADELLAINAVGFLLSTILSYSALKDDDQKRKQTKGKSGDIVFSASLFLLILICGTIAFELF
jgi:hypothetical protein